MNLASVLGPAPCASCGRRGAWLCAPCLQAARPASLGRRPANVDRVVARWAYEGGPRALLLRLKLHHLAGAAEPLVAGMVTAARTAGLDADLVTWVPARSRDISARGFDQAEVLARGLARRLGLPVAAALIRRGMQRDQSGLDRTLRMENLRGAFQAVGRVPDRVILIDDLITTGATADACATALKAGGSSHVTLLTPCAV
ncbi:MAG: ComF family protein [Actinomycetota bacterium]